MVHFFTCSQVDTSLLTSSMNGAMSSRTSFEAAISA